MNIANSVRIYNYCEIKGNVTIDENTIIGSHSVILGDVEIGKNCRIQSFAFIPGGVVIKDNVFIGPRVTILNDKYPPSKGKGWKPVLIEEGAVIGGNVTILPGVVISKGSKVGAGAVVTRSTLPDETVIGNPARKYTIQNKSI